MFLILFLKNIISVAIRRKMILRVAGMLLIIYFSLAIGIFLAEKANPSGNIKSVGDAFWFPLITLTTIGYGDRFPVTGVGRAITAICVLAGLGLMATLLSELPAFAMARAERKEKGLVPVKVSGHVIVANWQEEAATLAKELLAGDTPINDVVVVSRGERPFEDQPHWHWVAGNPSDEETLRRANINQATAVIAFPPEEEILREGEVADSLSLMIHSTVRRLNPDKWLGIFLNREENRKHFNSADAVINPARLGAMMMAQAFQDPGVEVVVSRLLSNLEGNTLFRTHVPTSVPSNFVGRTFGDLYEIPELIPVALVRNGQVTENPDKGTVLEATDDIIVIAPSRPVVK